LFGSILCTFATSMPMLASFRAVQGLGAGGLFSLALAIIGDIVPPRERAKYQGYFLTVFGTSSVLGPVVGGFFAGRSQILGITGWRWVFLVNVPIGIAALFVVNHTLHLRHTRLEHRIDFGGAIALTTGLVPLLLVAEQGRTWGWGSGASVTCYGIGLLGAIAFFLVERWMGAEALLPLSLFSLFTNKTVGVASIASVVLGMGMFGGLACLPLYLQIVKGATPTSAGLMLLPMTLGMMGGSMISGQIISKTGR
jgi:MFS family permease